MTGAAEVGDDGRQRGCDDSLVQRREQHSKHDRQEDEVAALRADKRAAGCRTRGWISLVRCCSRAGHACLWIPTQLKMSARRPGDTLRRVQLLAQLLHQLQLGLQIVDV